MFWSSVATWFTSSSDENSALYNSAALFLWSVICCRQSFWKFEIRWITSLISLASCFFWLFFKTFNNSSHFLTQSFISATLLWGLTLWLLTKAWDSSMIYWTFCNSSILEMTFLTWAFNAWCWSFNSREIRDFPICSSILCLKSPICWDLNIFCWGSHGSKKWTNAVLAVLRSCSTFSNSSLVQDDSSDCMFL